MANLILEVAKGKNSIELWATKFSLNSDARPLVVTRGHNVAHSHASHSVNGSFKWTKGVKALLVLATLTRLYERPVLWRGEAHSLTASLDYAISKVPSWMLDMFGSYKSGSPVVKRVFKQINPGRKMGGLVGVSISSNFLPWENISITHRGRELDKSELVSLYRSLTDEEPILHHKSVTEKDSSFENQRLMVA